MSSKSATDPAWPAAQVLGRYAELLASAVPRARGFALLAGDGQAVWNHELPDSELAVIGRRITAGHFSDSSMAEQGGADGSKNILIPLHEDASLLAWLIVSFSDPDHAPGSLALIERLLAPTLAVLVDALALRMSQEGREVGRATMERRLRAIYALDDAIITTPHGQAGLAGLVAAVAKDMRVGYSVLLMPDKRIRFSVTHPTWAGVDRKALDGVAARRLLPAVSARTSSLLLDVARAPTGITQHQDGYQIIASPIREGGKRVAGVLALFGQVENHSFRSNDMAFADHIARRTERVVELNYDRLTGLMNRSGFESHLKDAYEQLDALVPEHALIFFDLDKMTLFNDTFDHRAGDEVLVRFASELQRSLPERGVASRLAGDNFAVLLPETDVAAGVDFAEHIRLATHKMSYLKGDKSHQITVSAGVAPLRVSDEGYAGAMISPKVACTAAKDHGRDRVEVYDQENHSIIRRVDDMQIVGQIHNALNSGDFQLVAQPIVPLGPTANAHFPYYEVLVRMVDSNGKELRPSDFFSAAERYQLMPQLDRFVIESALETIAQHRAVLERSDARFAINLSGQSLQDDSLLEYVVSTINRLQVPARNLCFEITETAAVANMMSAQRFIHSLKSLGAIFSLDDFGAGLSSFAYLKSFNVDTLKIDGGFVRDLTTNKVSEAMVVAITHVARVMKLTTIAEYVEDEAARRRLLEIGVDYAQGYLVGEPQSLAEVLRTEVAAVAAASSAAGSASA
ncbi:MAG: EAL domain-containing protein [Pseudomonadota bacterium]